MTPGELKPGYEFVHTVTDYYDGPISGIANYQGKPHFYEGTFDESKDEYSDLFYLEPLSSETFQLAMEDWGIWERWEFAYHSGKADISTHPALPHDARRHAELKEILDKVLVIDQQRAIKRVGKFEALGETNLPKGVSRPRQVKWTEP